MQKLTKPEAQALLEKALAETTAKSAGRSYQPLESVKKQLEYLLAALSHRNDRSKLEEIIIGRYAAYEFEQSDPAYADLLYQVVGVTSLLLKGKL